MNCVRCGHAATLPGRFGQYGVDFTGFVPDGLRWFTLRTVLHVPARFHACTHCGHVWSECNSAELRALVDASASEELLATLRRRAAWVPVPGSARYRDVCPACHDTVYVGGGLRANIPERFCPEDLRLLTWTRSVELNYLSGESLLRACTGCGHVWGAVHAGLLRSVIENSGTDALKLRLRNLGMPSP
jgi:hypothetical protein